MTDVISTADVAVEMASELLATFAGMFTGMRRSDAVRIAAGNVTWAQHAILHAVITNERPMRVSDLAADIALSVASTTVATSRLEKQRLVRRVKDPADHRSVLIAITTRGAAAHRRSMDTAQAVLAEQLSALDELQIRALQESLPALTRLIELAAVDPLYGVASQSQTDMSPAG
jgi:DNA-binding MarR family transcriptional regulator